MTTEERLDRLEQRNRQLLVTIVAMVGVGVLAVCVEALADESLARTGYIGEDEVWSGTVLITGDVQIAGTATVVIEPGTQVVFAALQDDQGTGGNGLVDPITWDRPLIHSSELSQIVVDGILRAQGTPERPILFTSDSQDPTRWDWDGFFFNGDVRLQHCIVEHARGIGIGGSSVLIENCVFQHLSHNITIGNQSEPVLIGNLVRDCHMELNVRNASPTLIGNTIRTDMALEFDTFATIEANVFDWYGGSSGFGDHSTFRFNLFANNGDRGLLYRSDAVAKGNAFLDNPQNVVVDEGVGTADLSGNWWGTQDVEAIRDGISVHVDRPIVVEPVLSEPDPTTPIPAPVGVVGSLGDGSLTMAWDTPRMPGIAGYRVHYDTDPSYPFAGVDAAEGPSPVDAGAFTSLTLSGLVPGRRYYAAVSSYGADGRESWFSEAMVALTAGQTTGSIEGVVTDSATRRPIAGAVVEIDTANGACDDDGRFRIDGVTSGEYRLSASAHGYEAATTEAFRVAAGADSEVNVALEPVRIQGAFENITGIPEINIVNGPSVLTSAVDDDRNVWIGDFGGGILRWDGTAWTRFGLRDGLAQGVVSSIVFGPGGEMWLGHKDFVNASYFDGEAWHVVTPADGLPGANVWSMAIDHDGVVWAGCIPGGIAMFDGTSWTALGQHEELASRTAFAIAVGHDNTKWFGTMDGLVSYDGDVWRRYTRADGLPSDGVVAVCVEASGRVWAASDGYGVSVLDGGTWTTYTTADGLADNYVATMVEDADGNMWFGTIYNGLSRFDGTNWTHYSVGDGLVSHVVTSLTIDDAGHLWIGTWHGISKTRWPLAVRGPEVLPWDIDGDGTIDVVDLVTVAQAFGATGPGAFADANGDGRVNIIDLVTVAAHFGESTASAAPEMLSARHVDQIRTWVREAHGADDGSETFRRGLEVLESLLRAIVPETTALLPNYPNPFNPETWIPFELKQGSQVEVRIYDVSGRVIRHLDLGYRESGYYTNRAEAIYWDGRDETGEQAASGVYFYELRAGEFRDIRQMALLK